LEKQSVREMIEEALQEAKILESALEEFDEEHMLYTAMKLSNAPYSMVETVYREKYKSPINL
jgi:hypothetical protein